MSDSIDKPHQPSGSASVENGLAGNYSLAVGDVIREAWDRTSGNKGAVLPAPKPAPEGVACSMDANQATIAACLTSVNRSRY